MFLRLPTSRVSGASRRPENWSIPYAARSVECGVCVVHRARRLHPAPARANGLVWGGRSPESRPLSIAIVHSKIRNSKIRLLVRTFREEGELASLAITLHQSRYLRRHHRHHHHHHPQEHCHPLRPPDIGAVRSGWGGNKFIVSELIACNNRHAHTHTYMCTLTRVRTHGNMVIVFGGVDGAPQVSRANRQFRQRFLKESA